MYNREDNTKNATRISQRNQLSVTANQMIRLIKDFLLGFLFVFKVKYTINNHHP